MDHDPDLRNIDLNLLLVFDVLYRTRSATRAAESLHLTQPSVSNALKRLRTLFDDALFVKTADGMQPTPRADAIAIRVDEGLASLRGALQAGRSFDPATSTRTFRLYVNDLGQAIFIPPLVAQLHRVAPGIRIVTADPPLDAAQQMMKLGQIDLALGMFTGLHADFHQQRLFHETYVALVRNDHPAIGAALTVEQFFAADHVIYTPTAGSHARFEAMLDALSPHAGSTRRVTLQLAHSFGLERIVSSSDLVACIPSRLAHALSARDDVRAVPLPFDIAPADIAQFWHERFQRDEGHQWLRALVYDLFHDQRPSAVP
ncbi:MAG: LysR family transcriptional regulator [Burkholderia sp.]|uniref:LysR family transcriptional regulator n=2 Tax=Burkholderiaceae TaxID=119060 RepID=UPI00158AAB40|nr:MULTISPECIES: LysR family transcriptional regulator [Burkholderia]MBY8608803.1 LysR family transcriptional regulator [Burkholderia arboris]MCA3780517.1 LysR family transcriptional regulator [Burkholderia sp.]MCA3788829.1 LysR family transcriptional regulator [Burkholderia sp.]MCA3797609.1 LysR family transcriptional regulator [Burkholderia sp.]MCA3807138.1 LysR family transcriptional regulator [Burkholderia sp.]